MPLTTYEHYAISACCFMGGESLTLKNFDQSVTVGNSFKILIGRCLKSCQLFAGALSVVTHLWLLFDLFPIIRMGRNLRFLHKSLAIANILPVMFFFIGGISHFEQG